MKTYPLKAEQVPEFVAGATTLRLPVRPQPEWDGCRWLYERRDCRREVFVTEESLATALTFDCPYTVGSELALTEEWSRLDDPVGGLLHSEADGTVNVPLVYRQELDAAGIALPPEFHWRKAITMPAAFSRFKRRVTAVNVEHGELWEWVLTLEVL